MPSLPAAMPRLGAAVPSLSAAASSLGTAMAFLTAAVSSLGTAFPGLSKWRFSPYIFIVLKGIARRFAGAPKL